MAMPCCVYRSKSRPSPRAEDGPIRPSEFRRLSSHAQQSRNLRPANIDPTLRVPEPGFDALMGQRDGRQPHAHLSHGHHGECCRFDVLQAQPGPARRCKFGSDGRARKHLQRPG